MVTFYFTKVYSSALEGYKFEFNRKTFYSSFNITLHKQMEYTVAYSNINDHLEVKLF